MRNPINSIIAQALKLEELNGHLRDIIKSSSSLK